MSYGRFDDMLPDDQREKRQRREREIQFERCIYCALRLPPQARFCPKCGKPGRIKAGEIQCSCGAALIPQGEFCYKCGEYKDPKKRPRVQISL